MEVDAGLSTSGAGAEAPGSGFEEEDLDHIETKAFSATEYLNKLFPNEQSLSGLDEFLVKLRYARVRARFDGGGRGVASILRDSASTCGRRPRSRLSALPPSTPSSRNSRFVAY